MCLVFPIILDTTRNSDMVLQFFRSLLLIDKFTRLGERNTNIFASYFQNFEGISSRLGTIDILRQDKIFLEVTVTLHSSKLLQFFLLLT